MAIARTNINAEDDFLKVGPDVTATFDNSPSNPTEYASSENLDAFEDEDEDEDVDVEDEDLDEEDDEYEEEEDEDDFDEEDDDEVDDDDEEDEEEDEDEDDVDLVKGPKAPSVYRKL